MIRMDIKRNKIFSEFNELEQKKFFDCTRSKFLHKIDSFYYTCFINEDTCKDSLLKEHYGKLVQNFVDFLEIKKKFVIENNCEIEFGGLTLSRRKYKIYEYCLSLDEQFDIFIAKYIPNVNTPRIVIQLRSIGLWISGCEEMIKKSFSILEDMLKQFNLHVIETRENRIDYAYHTNAIQNSFKYFSDDKLLKHLSTQLEIYHKIGRVGRNLTIDYFSLGNRKSNNLFIRIYNKTREVLELGYKGFFIDYWYNNNMISLFDKFCYEYAYKQKSYNGLLIGRVKWYLKYGNDENLKKQLDLMLRDCSTNLKHIENFIKGIIPNVTLVVNVEFQTKRKFYYYSDKLIKILNTCNNDIPVLAKLFQIIDNRKIFLDYLTEQTLSFKNSKGTYVDWWKRLRSLKTSCVTHDVEFVRDYKLKLDAEKVKRRLMGNIASLSVYNSKKENSTFKEDISDLIATLNDNDTFGQVITFVDSNGEILDPAYDDYVNIRRKKYKSLKARINPDVNPSN